MIVGIDIGGTNIDVVALDLEFRHLGTFKTSEYLPKINEFLKEIDAKAVGIGIAAWIKEKPVFAPNLPKIPEIKTDKPVIIENDANCFAYYCAKILDVKNLIGITVGTGIGGGIVIDGKVYRGCGIAGEIGHTYVKGKKKCRCGGKGHLEAYFGGWALKNVKELVETGKIYKTRGFKLFCIAIANAIMLLNPEAVAIGGRIGGRLDIEIVKTNVSEYLPDVFVPDFYSIKDDLAVAKGACLLAKSSTS